VVEATEGTANKRDEENNWSGNFILELDSEAFHFSFQRTHSLATQSSAQQKRRSNTRSTCSVGDSFQIMGNTTMLLGVGNMLGFYGTVQVHFFGPRYSPIVPVICI